MGAIPPPVAAAYITVFIGMLFVQGMKIIIQDGVSDFLRGFASNTGWSPESAERLVLVGEETLLSMSEEENGLEPHRARRLVVTARNGVGGAELEFISAYEGDNLEDQLAYMGEAPEIADDREISFRLLRHYASSVHHQKYHGVDIVTVNVDAERD